MAIMNSPQNNKKPKRSPEEIMVNDLILDAQQELARERTAKLVKLIAPYLVTALVALVGGTAVMSVYNSHKHAQQEAAGAQFAAVFDTIQNQQTVDLSKLDAITEEAPKGYGALAQLQKASALAQQKKYSDAVSVYDALAKDSSVDDALRDIAALQAVQMLMQQDAVQFADQITTRLQALMKNDGAFAIPAQELLAVLYIQQGKVKEARETLTSITMQDNAPESLRQRAKTLLRGLPVEKS